MQTLLLIISQLETKIFNVDPSAGSVTFNAGLMSSGVVRISVNDDNLVENEETFSVTLRDPLGGACPNENRGNPHTLNIRILDNDGKELSQHIANLMTCMIPLVSKFG